MASQDRTRGKGKPGSQGLVGTGVDISEDVCLSVCSLKVELGVIRYWEGSMVSGGLHGNTLGAAAGRLGHRPVTRPTQAPGKTQGLGSEA